MELFGPEARVLRLQRGHVFARLSDQVGIQHVAEQNISVALELADRFVLPLRLRRHRSPPPSLPRLRNSAFLWNSTVAATTGPSTPARFWVRASKRFSP